MLFDHHVLQGAHVRLNWLRIDSGKQRVHFVPDLHVRDAALAENLRQNVPARAVHAVNRELETVSMASADAITSPDVGTDAI